VLIVVRSIRTVLHECSRFFDKLGIGTAKNRLFGGGTGNQPVCIIYRVREKGPSVL